MDKLTMANSWALKLLEINDGNIDIDYVTSAWSYADAMQAEADKRESNNIELKLNNDAKILYGDGLEIDWSQAPNWARYWAVDKDSSPFWHEDQPKSDDVEFYQCGMFCDAPRFNYQGNWQDSLRKRP